jgi:hypothetical protein
MMRYSEQTRAFRQMVRERGRQLRLLAYERLIVTKNDTAERIYVGGRKGTIETFCKVRDGEQVAVVVRGKLDTWLPLIKRVFRDGFYKHRDGSITDMVDDELHDYDPEISN